MSQDEYWVAEFSMRQDVWHVDTLASVLDSNRKWCILGPVENDYKIVAITSSHEEAHKIATLLKAKQEKQRTVRAEVELFSTARNRDGVLYSYDGVELDLYLMHSQRHIQAKFVDVPEEVTVGESFMCNVRLNRMPEQLDRVLYQGTKFEVRHGEKVIGQGEVIYSEL